jgi:hypothetical protein
VVQADGAPCWEYSDAAIDLVGSYMRGFPSVFTYLERCGRDDDACQAKDLFPEAKSEEEVAARMVQLSAWLREHRLPLRLH